METALDEGIVMEEVCSEHPDEKLKFYCTAHNELICCYCAVKKHKPCHDTLTFPESIDRFEREKSNLFKALSNQSNVIQQAAIERMTSLDNMASNSREMKQSVRDLCERLRNTIAEKESEMMRKIDEISKNQEESVKQDADVLQSLLQSSNTVKRKAELAFVKKNHLNIIKSMAKVQNTYCGIERSAKPLLAKPVQIMEFHASADVESFLDCLESLGDVTFTAVPLTPRSEVTSTSGFLSVRFGSPSTGLDVTCTTQGPQATPILADQRSSSSDEEMHQEGPEDSDSMEEMLSTLELSNPVSHKIIGKKLISITEKKTDGVEGESLMKFHTVDHGKPCWIYGLTFMADGRLVITDVAHDSLQLYDDSFNLLCETKVSFTPWDIAAMADNMAAVCAGGKGTINIFSLHNNDFVHLKNLEVGIDCISLAYSNSVLIAGTRRGAILMSEEGEIMKRLEKDQVTKQFFRRADFLSTDDNGGNIFITNSWAGKVVCLASEGRLKWEFLKKGANPRGVAWNRSNRKLYVACRSKNTVIFLDELGQDQGDVITEGLECPYALAVDPTSSRLVISQWDERMAAETSRSLHVFCPAQSKH